mmetsp:Transcript_3543/g.12742  ORF Transcript_3543/g.12742 Transcript_3543/m.12742 type:complete len:208 (+) Transcript_3543:2-625(+)
MRGYGRTAAASHHGGCCARAARRLRHHSHVGDCCRSDRSPLSPRLRRYGLRVGMLSSPDDYFVLVAMSLGIDVEYFSHYLPVMVKGPPEGVDERTYHDYRTRLAEDPRVIDMMNRHVSHKERLFFEAAQLVAAEWLASFNQTQLHQQKKRFAKERTRFLNSLGILHEGNRAFLDCKDAELVASLPKLDWRRSMLGGRGRGRGFKYCV